MKVPEAFATVFGLGYAPVAPGTVASGVALFLAWPLAIWQGRFALLLAGILASAIGAWACELYSREKGEADPSECVIDELAGQWIACAFAPPFVPAFLLSFVLFRIFDIWKPWPISAAERLPGGFGIMADDIVAGLFAGAIIAVLAHAQLV